LPPVTMLIKPASGLCNLRCDYCFYRDLATHRVSESYGMMTLDVLETITRNALETADEYCVFGFQGGEPTLAGLSFFESLIEFQKKYNTRGINIINTLQTNGTLLDENWARFLAQNKFLTGISIDGTARLHNCHRVTADGEGTLKQSLEAMRLLKTHRADCNVLCVVNKQVAQHPEQVYRFMQEQQVRYVQFVSCFNPLGEEEIIHDYTLLPDDYAVFLKITFDLWSRDLFTPQSMSIRTFDNYIDMVAGYPPEACSLNGFCQGYFLIEGDGTVFPCDFYCLDEYRLGNVMTHSFEELRTSAAMSEFTRISKHISPECNGCKWYSLCRGGCRRNREPFENGQLSHNRLCKAMYDFFEYSYPRMKLIAERMTMANRSR